MSMNPVESAYEIARSGEISYMRDISARRNRKRVIRYDKDCYRGRHLIENAFCRLKGFRCVHARYEKLAASFLSAVALATVVALWL
jgi:transposase